MKETGSRSRGKTVRTGGDAVIRQAISCDICGTEKKQTNHWFVAYEQGGELRVSGWSSRNRLRPGSKHLCGQTCLHKLVDEFMAKAIAVRGHAAADAAEVQSAGCWRVGRRSLTSNAAYVGGRIVGAADPTPKAPATPARHRSSLSAELVDDAGKAARGSDVAPLDEPPRFASRNWRAEAWERERERELRAVEHRPDIAARRRSSAWNGCRAGEKFDAGDGAAMWMDVLLLLVAVLPLDASRAGSASDALERLRCGCRTSFLIVCRSRIASSASRPASSITGTLSSSALSSLEPASSPATT